MGRLQTWRKFLFLQLAKDRVHFNAEGITGVETWTLDETKGLNQS